MTTLISNTISTNSMNNVFSDTVSDSLTPNNRNDEVNEVNEVNEVKTDGVNENIAPIVSTLDIPNVPVHRKWADMESDEEEDEGEEDEGEEDSDDEEDDSDEEEDSDEDNDEEEIDHRWSTLDKLLESQLQIGQALLMLLGTE